ncbi:2OG-Fe dioxygenase family protein [Pseudomonas capeferrum]|uniref:2OG-Fe dioxygenase family protein n=1 Tax=Pseudomonas capeferrum TaxID=1495066 RepID=UPI0015E2BB27|nr:2OG-Fe dioxygenase family protein [Pseudomonas capeferrum]MBA1204455.1 2OG-Fe dioxygenase family protein [Pseudomonas capeferrum]
MNTRERVTPQDQRTEAYFASQHSVQNLCEIVAQKDFAFLPARKIASLLSVIEPDALEDWAEFQESWNRLEQDMFMKDRGTYRLRRHATYSANPGSICPRLEAHQPHYQSLDYNTLNGGIARHFAPIEPGTAQNKVMTAALELCCTTFSRLAPYYTWHIEVHQFRINASQLAASPTPEGVHRDGVNFVFMMMVNRVNVVNGETSIYDRNKRPLSQYTLSEAMEAAIVNDEQTLHGVTPIIQLDPLQPAYRDVLVITFSKR